MTGAIQETSHERLYQELGLESSENRCWYRKLIFFHKIVNGTTPRYLTSYVSTNENPVYNTRASDQTKSEGIGQESNISNNYFSLSVLIMNGAN